MHFTGWLERLKAPVLPLIKGQTGTCCPGGHLRDAAQDDAVITCRVRGMVRAVETRKTPMQQRYALGINVMRVGVETFAIRGKMQGHVGLCIRQHVYAVVLRLRKGIVPARGVGQRPQHQRRGQ